LGLGWEMSEWGGFLFCYHMRGISAAFENRYWQWYERGRRIGCEGEGEGGGWE
jgi:hypothetical protein